LAPFRIVPTFSISMQSLGEIELRAPAVGAKIGVFCMSRLVCLRVGVYGSILMRFSALFDSGLFLQVHYIFLIFVARWRHNFR